MPLGLVVVQDKSTPTQEWIVGPFEDVYRATDWAEVNLPISSDWHIDELTRCADLPKELLKKS